MKKILLLLSFLCLTSCRVDFDFDSIHRNEALEEYKNAFTEEFGYYGILNIDKEHVWGFEDFESPVLTRGSFVNANEWSSYGLNVPLPLTEKQKTFVTDWFSETKNPSGIAVNWTEYFAQQVSSTEHGRHMDYLLDAGIKGNDHINNFNSGDCSYTNVDNKYQDKIMYMQRQSTKDFAYHESISDITWYDHYVIIPGEMIDPSNKLSSTDESIWGMYFVGFDYEAKGQSSNQIIPRDYYFNDWIIKISPGLMQESKMQRIMAEDLGNIGDFDFNDVVFDCWIDYNRSYGVIILRAAGGTMPLYVDGHEVHEEFNVDLSTMVNTGNGFAVNRPIVIWSFVPKTSNALDIDIIVENTKIHKTYLIESEKGEVPGKIDVPVNVNWSLEKVNIKTTYPKFSAWCVNQENKFWE